MNNLLISFDKAKVEKIAKKYRLAFVIFFGSKARGERANEESDLDIAVLSLQEPDYDLFGKIFSDFSDIFRGQNVDVRFLNDSDLLFRNSVVRDGVLLYGDENNYLNFKLLTIKRYVDDGKKYFPAVRRLIERKLEDLQKGIANPQDCEMFWRISTQNLMKKSFTAQ